MHEFNDLLVFEVPRHLALNLERGCFVRVLLHYRAGDVFRGFFEPPNVHSVSIEALQSVVAQLRAIFAHERMRVDFHVLTELGFDDAVKLSELLGGVNVLFASDDDKKQLALAEYADILVLELSAFSWLLSLFAQPSALKIITGRPSPWTSIDRRATLSPSTATSWKAASLPSLQRNEPAMSACETIFNEKRDSNSYQRMKTFDV